VLSGRLAALGGSVDLGAFFITDAITDAPRCIINIQYIYIYGGAILHPMCRMGFYTHGPNVHPTGPTQPASSLPSPDQPHLPTPGPRERER
jgi:hypothetical protein